MGLVDDITGMLEEIQQLRNTRNRAVRRRDAAQNEISRRQNEEAQASIEITNLNAQLLAKLRQLKVLIPDE